MRFVLFIIFGFMLCEMEAKMKGRGNQASKFLRAFLARNNAVVDSKGRIRPVDKYSFRMPWLQIIQRIKEQTCAKILFLTDAYPHNIDRPRFRLLQPIPHKHKLYCISYIIHHKLYCITLSGEITYNVVSLVFIGSPVVVGEILTFWKIWQNFIE